MSARAIVVALSFLCIASQASANSFGSVTVTLENVAPTQNPIELKTSATAYYLTDAGNPTNATNLYGQHKILGAATVVWPFDYYLRSYYNETHSAIQVPYGCYHAEFWISAMNILGNVDSRSTNTEDTCVEEPTSGGSATQGTVKNQDGYTDPGSGGGGSGDAPGGGVSYPRATCCFPDGTCLPCM